MDSISSVNCDIIVPIWNNGELTKRCLESVLRSTEEPIRFILIDNGSLPRTRDALDDFQKKSPVPVQLFRNATNRGFVKAVNQGIQASQAPWICLLNNDTIVTSGWLKEMLRVADSSAQIGLVNPTSNSLGFDPGKGPLESFALSLKSQAGQWVELPMALGFCLVAKRSLFDRVGLFDESFGMGYFEDDDLSRRVKKAGFLCVRACAAYVFHEERASFDQLPKKEVLFRENRRRFEQRWGRSLRILWAAPPVEVEEAVSFPKETLLQLAREGHWLTFPDPGPAPANGPAGGPRRNIPSELSTHAQVNFLRAKSGQWRWVILRQLLLKRKKPFHLIVSYDEVCSQWIRRLRWFHAARLLHSPTEKEILEACRSLSGATNGR